MLPTSKAKIDKQRYVIGFLCACAGSAATMIATPNPTDKPACGTYRVINKVATSYVLKPPPAPPAERVVVKEACVSPKPESDTQADLSVTDDTQKKPRRRHHRRYRAYWK